MILIPIYYYEGQIMLRSTNGRGLATNFTVAPLIEYYCGEKYDWYDFTRRNR